MAKPTDSMEWASSGAAIVEPLEAKKDIGWLVGEKPPAQYFNWWMNNAYLWQQYFEEITEGTAGSVPTLSGMIGINFQSVTNTFTGNMNQLATNDSGVVVGVGNNGIIIYSTNDGKTFSETSDGVDHYYAASYRAAGAIWIIAGAGPSIKTATNPAGPWTTRTTTGATGFFSALHDNGTHCVAVTSSGQMFYSTDTVIWTQGTIAVVNPLTTVSYGASKWVVSGNDSFVQYASTPDAAWTAVSTGLDTVTSHIYDICYGDKFVAVGNVDADGRGSIATSADGVSWTAHLEASPIFAALTSVVYNPNSKLYVATSASESGTTGVMFSGDGQNWIKKRLSTSSYITKGAAYGNKRVYVAQYGLSAIWYSDDIETLRNELGDNTVSLATTISNVTTNTANIATNTAGIASGLTDIANLYNSKILNSMYFTDIPASPINGFSRGRGMIYGANSTGTTQYIAMANGPDLVFSYFDFLTTDITFGTQTIGASGGFSDIAGNNTHGVAVGAGLVGEGSPGVIYTNSFTGFGNWQVRTSGTSNALSHVAGNSAYWVASSQYNNTLRYNTTDPSTAWSASTSGLDGATSFVGLATDGTKFTAITTDNEVIYTANPASGWTLSGTVSGIGSLGYLDYIGGKWVAYGTGSTTYFYSDNGLVWSSSVIGGGLTGIDHFNAVPINNGQYVWFATKGVKFSWSNDLASISNAGFGRASGDETMSSFVYVARMARFFCAGAGYGFSLRSD